MWVIQAITVDDSNLTASNIPENDYPTWNSGLAYTTGERAILASTHSVYQAVKATTGNDPATDDGTNWVRVGATERWKPFDGVLSDYATENVDITYTITTPSLVNAIALFGLKGTEVTITIVDPAGPTTVHTETRSIVEDSDVLDGYSYAYAPLSAQNEVVFQHLPGLPGYEITITIASTGAEARRVSEIVLGRDYYIGKLLGGATVGINDYSRKERDAFGTALIIPRAFAETLTYPIWLEARRVARVMRYLAVNFRAKGAVYHGGEDLTRYGMTIFGFFTDLPVTVATLDSATINLEIEGLT